MSKFELIDEMLTGKDGQSKPAKRPPSPVSTGSNKGEAAGDAAEKRPGARCPMFPPKGTVCKTCGKVHPL